MSTLAELAGLTADQVPTVEPGSPEWLRYMSASKIAAVVGLNPWESKYSMWCVMSGLLDPAPETDQQRRGHYLEPAVAAWLADQHPEYEMRPGGSWVSREHPWYLASPDRLFCVDGRVAELVEVKSDANGEEWGEPGTDEIPIYYRVQVQVQMDVLGVHRTRLGLITGRLEFREYIVDYDVDDAEYLRAEAEEFLLSIAWGEMPPIDGHRATVTSIRRRHPLIDPKTFFDVPDDLATRVIPVLEAEKGAEQDLKQAKERAAKARAELLDAMGTRATARYADTNFARRQAKKGGLPYLVVDSALPPAPEPQGAAAA
ncbi:lambda-exonuclease family protein [Nonomuraea sp. NPDC050663]|uniref:lambda-exonuclease family protein n=1 Tax=Nonomuraea sp. NPDC050663 TaxID=3364370 RepID=UPI003790C125